MQNSTKLIYSGVSSMFKAFFIKGRKTVIVDTSVPGNAQNILSALERNGIPRESVSLILLTHGHTDHYGSAQALNEVLHVPIMIGKADAKYVVAGDSAPAPSLSIAGKIAERVFSRKVDGHSILIKPDILIDGATDLSEFGVDAEAFPTPGHTYGSVSVAVRGGDCAIGDLLAGIPPMGRPRFPVFAEDPNAVGPSLKKVFDHDPAGLCPAHGRRIQAAEARKKFAGLIG